MKFISKTKYLIIIFVMFISTVIFIIQNTYNQHVEKMEYLSSQFNSIVYEFYLNVKDGKVKKDYNYDILNTGLIKNMYIYNKNDRKLIHFFKNSTIYNKIELLKNIDKKIDFKNNCDKKIDERFTETFFSVESCSIIYDSKLGNYSLMYLDIPAEYKSLQLKIITILVFSSILIIFILMAIYNKYNKIIINEKVAETINLFKDTSFIVSNFNHEINTPLTSIETSLYELSLENSICDKDNSDCARIGNMNKTIKNIAKDIEFIKSFISKISTLKMINGKAEKTTNLYETLEIIKSTVENITTTKMDIDIDDKFKKIQLKISSEYLYSIFVNLIKNSYEADASYASLYSLRTNKDKICIMYRDNGKGIKVIPPENIFKKDISSKKSKTSRGFGMFFIRSILESHNGSINIVKTSKYGTEFKIQVPYEEVI